MSHHSFNNIAATGTITSTNVAATNIATVGINISSSVSASEMKGNSVSLSAFSYYGLNNNGNDDIGGIHLADGGGTPVTYDSNDKKTGSHSGVFDATDKYLTDDDDEFDYGRNDAFSFDFWIKIGTGGDYRIIGKGDFIDSGYYIYVTNTNDIGIRFIDDALGSEIQIIYTDLALNILGTWTHITMTYNGSRKASGILLYVNSVEYTIGRTVVIDALGGNFKNNDDFTISGDTDPDFKIDALAVYDKTLMHSEVESRYNDGNGVDDGIISGYAYEINTDGDTIIKSLRITETMIGSGTAVVRTAGGDLIEKSSSLMTKTNIEDLTTADVAWVYTIPVKKFNMRTMNPDRTFSETNYHARKETGIIAEELKEIPSGAHHCVHCCNGRLKTVDYLGMIGDLIKCVQDLQQRITTLEGL